MPAVKFVPRHKCADLRVRNHNGHIFFLLYTCQKHFKMLYIINFSSGKFSILIWISVFLYEWKQSPRFAFVILINKFTQAIKWGIYYWCFLVFTFRRRLIHRKSRHTTIAKLIFRNHTAHRSIYKYSISLNIHMACVVLRFVVLGYRTILPMLFRIPSLAFEAIFLRVPLY